MNVNTRRDNRKIEYRCMTLLLTYTIGICADLPTELHCLLRQHLSHSLKSGANAHLLLAPYPRHSSQRPPVSGSIMFIALNWTDSIEFRQITLAVVTILLALSSVVYVCSRPRPRGKTPPGPRGLPILGNALQVPSQVCYKQFTTDTFKASFLLISTWGDTFALYLRHTEDWFR